MSLESTRSIGVLGIIIAAALLLLASCGLLPSPDVNTRDLFNPFIGSQGMAVEFLPSAPPEQVYGGTGFRVGLLVQNKGALPVTDGVVKLALLDRYFSMSSTSRSGISLEGKTLLRKSGEKDTIFFDGTVGSDVPYDGIVTPIAANVCYGYTTRMSDTVCVDPDIYNIDQTDKTCYVRNLALRDQGAPVAVTRVDLTQLDDSGGVKVYANIRFRNVGGGIVADSSSSALCSEDGPGDGSINHVRVSATLGGRSMNCGPTGANSANVRMDGGSGSVGCEVIISASEEYETAMQVQLDYAYSTVIQQNVEIRAPPGGSRGATAAPRSSTSGGSTGTGGSGSTGSSGSGCSISTGGSCGSGGQCQTSSCGAITVGSSCTVSGQAGSYHANLCPGGTDTRCCVPFPAGVS